VRVGVGKFTKENEDTYECEWVDDLPDGFGKICYASGTLTLALMDSSPTLTTVVTG